MKTIIFSFLAGLILFIMSNVFAGNQIVRLNLPGNSLQSVKGTGFLSFEDINQKMFSFHDDLNDKEGYSGDEEPKLAEIWGDMIRHFSFKGYRFKPINK